MESGSSSKSKPGPQPMSIDRKSFEDVFKTTRSNLDTNVRSVMLLRGKGNTGIFENHWSIHFKVPGGGREVRLDMACLDPRVHVDHEKLPPNNGFVSGRVTTKFLSPKDKSRHSNSAAGDKIAESPPKDVDMWLYREDRHHLVLEFATNGEHKVEEFLAVMDVDSVMRPSILSDGTNGCADWSAKVIDLFIKREFIQPVQGKGVFEVVHAFKLGRLGKYKLTSHFSNPEKKRCGLDFPIQTV
ncbi:hypothetical protein GE09DRAFT_1057674 [Coniochaeta sp. 2T2.1]|nr:hypothetical protein GE09DRAFT_1057674 [Coniochaeta sp. 2T2.1]